MSLLSMGSFDQNIDFQYDLTCRDKKFNSFIKMFPKTKIVPKKYGTKCFTVPLNTHLNVKFPSIHPRWHFPCSAVSLLL